MDGAPKIICLTPVRNEAWILERFLAAASVWADHILVADQHSTDGSREIAARFPKVTLIENPSEGFNEPERQQLLIAEARKIEGPKLLVALDADEFISADAFGSSAWRRMLEAAPGTVIHFKWPCIESGFRRYWDSQRSHYPRAYMDDGAGHTGRVIHSIRVPNPRGAPQLRIDGFVILHFQFTDWERMRSKHRWYQCYERCAFPRKSAIAIFRMYHHMDRVREEDKKPVPDAWFDAYERLGIDLRKQHCSGHLYWDELVGRMLAEKGAALFRHIDLPGNDNLLLKYLRATRSSPYRWYERWFDKYLGGIR